MTEMSETTPDLSKEAESMLIENQIKQLDMFCGILIAIIMGITGMAIYAF